MIPSPDAVLFVIDALNELGVAYLITGSIASNAYGEPRATIDADFVADVTSEQLDRLLRRLDERFDREPQLAFETVTGKVQHRFRDQQSKFMIEIFEAKLDDPHERARLERRVPQSLFKKDTFFPTAEDVIIQKLRWLRQIRRAKDRGDVLKVLQHQWSKLDWPYIERWCAEHGTLDLFTQLRVETQSMIDNQ